MTALLLALALAAAPDTLQFVGKDLQLEVAPPRVESPAIRIDGVLDEPEWENAATLSGFSQYEPLEGIPASESTEVRILYSGEAIYFGIKAFDSQPHLILARLGERDRSVFGDDWVRIILDTFDDQRQGYVFYVNPLGIQTDGLWMEGYTRQGSRTSSVPIDFSPDFIWDSDGRLTSRGWEAEIRIPYVSLRFHPAPVQNWGLNVAREVKRRGFKQSWAPLTRNVASTLAQSGRLVGLRDLRPKRLVELNPVTTGKRLGQVADGRFRREAFHGEVGFNTRVGITRNLVMDATVNPDFSQVEADATRITVNERFALFFPEKRPFFLEGSEAFQTPQQLVHTRTIVNPVAGAKLTGKVGSVTTGYLGVLDDSPSGTLENPGKAAVNLLRLRKDVGAGSTVGVLYSDRTLTGSGDFNRVLAADTRLTLGEQHTLTTQWAASWSSADGERDPFKPSIYASVARTGRTLQWDATVHDMHPRFRTWIGYLPRIGETVGTANFSLTHYGKAGDLLERATVGIRGESYFLHHTFWEGGGPYEAEFQLLPSFSFRGDRTLSLILRNGYFEFPLGLYRGFQIRTPDGSVLPFPRPSSLKNLKAVALMPRLRLNNSANLNGRVYFREVPIYAEAGRGLEFLLAPQLTLKPTTSLSVTLDQTYSRLWRQGGRTVFSTAVVSRVQTQYQFSKALMARMMVQYDLEDRDALRPPGEGESILLDGEPVEAREEGTVQGQFLLQYQPSPGTIFYVGYTGIMEGDYSYGLAGKDPSQDGLFLKLSYLFRL